MKPDNQDLKLLLIAVCSFLAAYFIPAGWILHFNDFPNWYHYRSFAQKTRLPVKIVAVAIDDYSLNKISMQWPWKRTVYAQAIKVLDNEGVKTIGFDLALKGASEDPQDDQALADTLRNTKAAVVLGYDFDYKTLSPGLPSPEIMAADPAVGMLNTPLDDDQTIRRMRVKYRVGSAEYYSFSVIMAASFLGKEPADIISSLPVVKDRRFLELQNLEDSFFYINYLVRYNERNASVSSVSFSDILNNMDKLKKERGDDFLKNSLVLVYPAAEIRHDVHKTPLGRMPGGFSHLNGIINVFSHSAVDSPRHIPVIFAILSAFVLFLALRSSNSQIGWVACITVIVFNVIGALLLWHFNIKTDFIRVVILSGLFAAAAGLYKYVEFLARLNSIKDRATLDPLRGVYTLRYFRYRLELEARRRKVYVIMIYFEHFKENVEDIPIDRLKNLWGMIHLVISKGRGCWATYSADEIIGFSLDNRARVEASLQPLKDSLEEIFASIDLKVVVKVCAVQFRKDWGLTELFASLSHKARSLVAGALVIQDFQVARPGQAVSAQGAGEHMQLLDGLAEDIEEKNRQLLNMYEKLKIEHGKTKEAFYQIITSLVNALEARDAYTQGHSQRVANYALALADKLGWDPEQKEKLRKASLLHDLGKIGIPDAILHKRGQLTEEEFGFIKQHEIFAVNILKPLKEIEDILPWILYHHEKWDGTGYPHGLGGDAIPLASQIIAVADVYDALTTGRDYKIAVARADSIAILLKGKGTHFNPELVDMFVSIVSQQTL